MSSRYFISLLGFLCLVLIPAEAFAPNFLSTSRTIRFDKTKDVSRLMDADSPIAEVEVPETVTKISGAVIQNADPVGEYSALHSPVPDLDTIALVVGQENYGLAIVLLGEAVWSLSQAPSLDHALKTLLPAAIAAAVLVGVSGPMVTSGDVGSVGTGLFIATAVSVLMGMAYLARCLAPFSPSPKEIPAFGILVALAGFFSFSQNLVVDGFVTLPQLPSVSLPSFPEIQLPF
eukprot:scaffold22560_cov135-Cylindrotheca_fusiformis.AAC.56